MRFGNLAVALAFTGVAAAAQAAPAAAQTIKIGLVYSSSGFAAQVGDEMEKGISLYVRTHEKDCRPASKSS
ncbi:MAG TPA: hypothetical protein VEK55_03330 [Xanthobacteraceae bacterium]|nr:hypothetical protein [Xanthobacteraceae bacterium]